MDRYHITGGKRLEGDCRADGAKNAALPIMAATVLSGRESVMTNCPNIKDVRIMGNILRQLGCKVQFEDGALIVDSSHVECGGIADALTSQMRSSVFLMGPMIARCGQIHISYPGGCEIGLRPIDIHLKVLRQLGVEIKESHGFLQCDGSKLKGNVVQLDFPSVGATENGMMAAVLAEGETRLQNVAREPEVVDLQNFLNSMGARVKGAGTEEIIISGVEALTGTQYRVMPDRIAAGTYLTAAAITGGEITVRNMEPGHLGIVLSKLRETGCEVREEAGLVHIKAPERLSEIRLKTLPYPGFPTDMQSQFLAMLCTAQGTSIIKETIFESRYKPVEELLKMGARIIVEDRLAIITGVKRLMGAKLSAGDLRGGAALVLAGLAAEGETVVDNIEYIDRGYEKLENGLSYLGAEISRISENGGNNKKRKAAQAGSGGHD